MNALKPPGDVRLLPILLALCALAACGQQDQSASDPAEESAAGEAALTEKVPVTTSSDEARALYEKGLALADNLHFIEANEAFAGSVEIDPDFAMGYLRLAQTSQSAAAFFKAVGLAEDNAKNGTEGEQLYVRALIAAAEYDQAMQLESSLALMSMYPKDERTHMQVADYFIGQQKFADAIKHYGHATAINPDFASAFNALGYAHRNNDNLAGAREAFARYVELIPDEANPYDSYAELLLEMGEYDESIENYRKAIEINPNFVSAYAGITIDQSLKGDAEAAQAAAAEMLAAARNAGQRQGAMFRSVTSHLFAGNVEAALAVSEERYAAAEADGHHATMGGIREYMGDIVMKSGDGAKALEYFESALSHRQQANFNDANKAQAERAYLFKASIAAMVAGDLETAASRAAEYTTAVETSGTASERLRIHELAGYLAGAKEDFETSAAEHSQASQLNPVVLYWSAVANKNIGNTEKARDLATRAATRNTLSANLPFFRSEALQLLEELEAN